MMNAPELLFGLTQWLSLFFHFLSLSLLSIGGAIATAPEMHRFLVTEQHWLSDAQFNASIAIAQAAPGPNVLFVALLGWNVGLNTGSTVAPYLGLSLSLLGSLLPSTVLTYVAAQWGYRNREKLAVRAFKQGMAPLVVALLIATGWVLAGNNSNPSKSIIQDWPLWLLTISATLLLWRTQIHLLWLLGAGALLGWFGLI
jgi:chromate transporter